MRCRAPARGSHPHRRRQRDHDDEPIELVESAGVVADELERLPVCHSTSVSQTKMELAEPTALIADRCQPIAVRSIPVEEVAADPERRGGPPTAMTSSRCGSDSRPTSAPGSPPREPMAGSEPGRRFESRTRARPARPRKPTRLRLAASREPAEKRRNRDSVYGARKKKAVGNNGEVQDRPAGVPVVELHPS